jgi:hypothetical protein
VVREHLETFLAAAARTDGIGLPRSIEREFRLPPVRAARPWLSRASACASSMRGAWPGPDDASTTIARLGRADVAAGSCPLPSPTGAEFAEPTNADRIVECLLALELVGQTTARVRV